MIGLVMLAKVFARAVEASFHCRDAGGKNFRDLRMTATLLDQCEERAILRAELRERVAQGVEFLGVDRAGRLGNVFVLFAEGEENPPQLLAAQLIDARVARETEKPRLELRGRLQTIQRANHLDEHLLRQVFDVIAASGHGVNEAGNAMLVTDDELALGGFIALLSPPNEVGQRSR
jgi:hypothetical protein